MADIVFCADDFTGASDTLATLARAGKSARLYLSPPRISDHPEIAGLDAIGVATSLRALSVKDGINRMNELVAGLSGAGGKIHHFKVCSTFDSSPRIGNIAQVADCFAKGIDAHWQAIIGGQPSLGRYCVFGNLFAAASNGTIHRIDRHPVMRTHPVTPMAEADLRQHLNAQGWPDIGLIDITLIRRGARALTAEIQNRMAAGETHTLFDAAENHDLEIIGQALHAIAVNTKILCIGASSVAQALTASNGANDTPPIKTAPAPITQRNGPVFAFAGSRSPLTAQQVAATRHLHKIEITPGNLMDPTGFADMTKACMDVLADGKHLLATLGDDAAHGIGGHELAKASARFIANVITQTRIGFLAIAGGDTSSLAVLELPIDSLSFVEDFDRGVPVIRAHGSDPQLDGLEMILKGGQMGQTDIFDQVVNRTETGSRTR